MKQEKIRLPKDVASVPTLYGTFCTFVVTDDAGREHAVLVNREIDENAPVLVRVHSECFTGDIIGSLRCDCQPQLNMALERVGAEGGVIVYLRQEGRGIGLANKIKAYALQERGKDTVEANEELGFPIDGRQYDIAASVLQQMGIHHIRLMTNNPKKVEELQKLGITVTERIPIEAEASAHNREYIQTKKEKMGHLFGDE